MNPKPPNNDYNLVLLLKEGNTEAFKIIFNQYKSKLYFFALAYLHSPAEVDEIIQNVFLSLWEHRQSLNETLSVKSYLYKITVNHVLNHLKHEAVKQKYINYALRNHSEVDDQSQENIDFDDLKVMIENIIERLPAQQQKIFKMSRWEGQSHVEIATQLGLSVRSVENQVYRALKFIKTNLKEEYLTL